MKLTCGKLLKEADWDEWQTGEGLQLDQYKHQEMFGDPIWVDSNKASFNLVWTYVLKVLNQRKKSHCTCNGSPCGGQAQVLDHTYTNPVDQTTVYERLGRQETIAYISSPMPCL